MKECKIPQAKLGELCRDMALIDGEVNVLAPEGTTDQVDKWETIDTAELDCVEWVERDGMVAAHFKTETRIEEKVRRATGIEPAEYRNHYLETWVSIWWDLDPESSVNVDIEVTGREA